MFMNLTDVFTSEGKDREESVCFEADEISYMGNTYRILEKSPVRLKCSNIGTGKALVCGGAEIVFSIPCDRCLKEVRVPVVVSFEEEAISPEAIQEENEQEEQSFLKGYELDVEALVNNEILVNMPVKVLCKPDCKGICKQCGHDLNEGGCGCDTFVPDPRMAAIKDIFNANKEV